MDEELPARRQPEIPHGSSESRSGYDVSGQFIQQFTFRQAPYPPPDELAQYEQIHPGFTDRILDLAESETRHRHDQSNRRDNATIGLAQRGQTFAFVVVMTLVLGAIASILTDHSIVGLAALVVAAATLAGAFFLPRSLAGDDPSKTPSPGNELATPPADPESGG